MFVSDTIPPMRSCAATNCSRPVSARGWCKVHYERWRTGRPLGDGNIQPSRETMGERMTSHGHTVGYAASPTYRSWENMLNRCRNPRTPAYARYGGRGIGVCNRWMDFAAFLNDMGERPSPKHSLDRYPNR